MATLWVVGLLAGLLAGAVGAWLALPVIVPEKRSAPVKQELVAEPASSAVLPPTVDVPPQPAIAPEEEMSARVESEKLAVVVEPPPAKAVAVSPPVVAAEGPWVNILPKDIFLAGESFRRFYPSFSEKGKIEEAWFVAFSPKPGTEIRAPFAGSASTTARAVVDGKWYPTISLVGTFEGENVDLTFITPSLLKLVQVSVKEWDVIAEVGGDTLLPFEGRYGLLIYITIRQERGMDQISSDLLWKLFPHAKP